MNKIFNRLFLFLLLLIYNSISFGQEVNFSDWKYKRLILIDNKPNSETIKNHPFLIILDSTYIDFSLAKPKGEDLLFVDRDEETILSFWIESWTPPIAKVWVNIPEVLSNDEKTITMFYGNSNSDILSNGKTTFTFFDSFERFNDPTKNAENPLTTPTYDGSGQAVHPDIVYVPEKWNGYKYWMTLTPYPGSNDNYENPSIIVSNDGVSWIEPSGISNPLVPEPDGYNNDPDMLLVDSLMILYFNESNINETTYIKRMTSTDGVNWSTPETVISVPWHLMSPTVIYEDETYYMWYVRSPKGCWSNFQNLTMRTSTDGINWGNEIFVNIPFDGRVVWHLDVKKVGSKYVMIFPSYSKNSDCHGTSLFYAESTDKTNWDVNNSPIIVSSNSSTTWDNGKIYRSTFLLENGFLRLWYSAVSNLGVWNIGYTEDDLSEFLNKIFWNNKEGGVIASHDLAHSGEFGLKEYPEESSSNPKVYKSISKKGSYNVWFYDEMNIGNDYKAIFCITDINGKKIGLGVNKNESSTKYIYHKDNFNYSTTNILRSEGWHKFTTIVKNNSSDLYIDNHFVKSINDLDESNITRLSLEGGNSGNGWFDDVYWYKLLDFGPNISALFSPEIVNPIEDLAITEDDNSKMLALLDSVFTDHDTSSSLEYHVSESDSGVVAWISNEKLWIEPKKDYNGLDSIFVSATNRYGLFSIDTLLLETKSINDPPILKGMPDIYLNEDDTINVNLNSFVTDIDSDTSNIRFIARLLASANNNYGQTISVNNEKNSMFILENSQLTININNVNNIAEIFAEPDSTGTFRVLFTAIDDSLATDSDTTTIRVLSVNDYPTITDLPDTLFTTKDSTLELKMWNFISDKETPDSLLQYKFLIEDSELNIDFNNKNGILTINVIKEFTGTSNLFITITDDGNAKVQETIAVKVNKVTGVESLEDELPRNYSLNQNYPNPFNPRTTISFDLPLKSKVHLDIYNLLGQKISNIVNEDLEAGTYSISVDIPDLTSGVYIYLFTAIDLQNNVFHNSRKMILLK